MESLEKFEYTRTEIEKIVVSVCFAVILPFLLHFLICDFVSNLIASTEKPTKLTRYIEETDDYFKQREEVLQENK